MASLLGAPFGSEDVTEAAVAAGRRVAAELGLRLTATLVGAKASAVQHISACTMQQ